MLAKLQVRRGPGCFVLQIRGLCKPLLDKDLKRWLPGEDSNLEPSG